MSVADHNTRGSGASEPTYVSNSAPVEGSSILGLDNVPLDLRLAGLGTRSLAMLVDGVVLLVLLVLWAAFMATLASFSNIAAPWLWAAAAFGYFLLQWGYFSACEILMDGRTPGKLTLSLQTVSHLGGRPSVGAIVIRNLLRPMDYMFGVFFMALDARSRRLGDMVASTLVVHRGDLGPADGFRLGRVPAAWGAEEVMLVESFLRRAARMESSIAQDLSARLVQWIERTDPAFFEAAQPLPDLDSAKLGGAPVELHHLCALLAVETVGPAAS